MRLICLTCTLFCLFTMLTALAQSARGEEARMLKLTTQNIHDATLRNSENGVVEIHTTGSDPYVFVESLTPVLDKRQHVLTFEYFSATGTDSFQVFVLPPLREAHSVMGRGLSVSEGWSAHSVDLKPVLDRPDMPREGVRQLRLDFGTQAGKTIQIRGLQLRPQTAQEIRLEARREALRETEKQHETHLRDYLHRAYLCHLTRIRADKRQIHIEGDLRKERGAIYLVETLLYENVTEQQQFPFAIPIHADADGRFTLTLERQGMQKAEGSGKQNGRAGVTRNHEQTDRLLSRWAIARKTETRMELLSHARYVDTVASKADLPEVPIRSKKGLGGFVTGFPVSDLDDLGISAVTINVVLNGFMRSAPGVGRTPFPYQGHTWYTDDRRIAEMDKTLLETSKRNLVVSAIILLGQPGDAPKDDYSRIAAHPDADPAGIFAMPDVTTAQGLNAYAAALEFLARRYSRPDAQYGRIHHWILHNEVNAGWIWTNAGDKTALLYMDLYHKSMRVAYLIARQYNPHARVFISLEHHWLAVPDARIYSGRFLLETLADYSRAEGDFDWSVAYHPYPQNLFEPRVWEDNEINFTFDTPKITFKNLEVLDAWLKQPRMLYLGKFARKAHLTEQGLNSRDYSQSALLNQAAGMAYAWNKYKNLGTIEVFHYHNWVDNRGEGGLRIGLRRFPDDKEEPLGRKPIWFVYQALGTAKEAEATAFALPLIGIKDWAEARHPAQ